MAALICASADFGRVSLRQTHRGQRPVLQTRVHGATRRRPRRAFLRVGRLLPAARLTANPRALPTPESLAVHPPIVMVLTRDLLWPRADALAARLLLTAPPAAAVTLCRARICRARIRAPASRIGHVSAAATPLIRIRARRAFCIRLRAEPMLCARRRGRRTTADPKQIARQGARLAPRRAVAHKAAIMTPHHAARASRALGDGRAAHVATLLQIPPARVQMRERARRTRPRPVGSSSRNAGPRRWMSQSRGA